VIRLLIADDHPAVVRDGLRGMVASEPDLEVVSAIEAGATGFLLKDAPRAELFRAVRAAARPLTQRELQVLELVARGATNREVAARLQVSEATVKTHLVHAFGKLGVSDRTAAVTAALERRLIRLDG
jgi:DNA-binding NarL/FixJ family response regulator